MRRLIEYVPFICGSALVIGLSIFGPIHQFADYHAFADQSNIGAIPHAADVLSNGAFALVAAWAAWSRPLHNLLRGRILLLRCSLYSRTGALLEANFGRSLQLCRGLWSVWFARRGSLPSNLLSQSPKSSTTAHQSKQTLWSVKSVALNLFIFGLFATSLGSGYYHWAPDNMRLFWDRLPIVLTCAGLLGAAHADSAQGSRESHSFFPLILFLAGGVASVLWWWFTDQDGEGDLRWYLLFQISPLVLVPIWYSIYPTPKRTRWLFAIALLTYVFAKMAEMQDHTIYAWSGFITGHTLKHLLASVAAALIAHALITYKNPR